MNLRLLSIILAIFVSFANISANIPEIGTTQWLDVDTENNKIGLQTGTCKFNPKTKTIICEEAKIEFPVSVHNVSATGTPPWLQFKSNYVGQTTMETKGSKPGQSKRKIYLKK